MDAEPMASSLQRLGVDTASRVADALAWSSSDRSWKKRLQAGIRSR